MIHYCRYGHLTWEWAAGLRGYTHPLIFALPYQILQFLELDSTLAVVAAPKVLQGLLAAIADVAVHLLTKLTFGSKAARCDALLPSLG